MEVVIELFFIFFVFYTRDRQPLTCIDYSHYSVLWRKHLTVNANTRDFQSETRLWLTNLVA